MSKRATTTLSASKRKWYVRFNPDTGRILSIGPRPIAKINDDEEVTSIENPICKEIIAGKKNVSKFAMHWDVVHDEWDIDVKSSTLNLETRGEKLNQFTEGVHPGGSDFFIQIMRKENKMKVQVNFLTIRNALNLGQINQIKNDNPNILDLYVCKKNNPDYLIGVIPIDALLLFNMQTMYIDISSKITDHINSWDDISIFTQPVFNTYGLEFTDVSVKQEVIDHSRLHQKSDVSEDSHINMYTLNDKLIIDSKIDQAMLYYFNGMKQIKLHVSDTHIDNYITTLTINVTRLLKDKIEIQLPTYWPTKPLITFNNTQLTVNYLGDNNE